MEEGSQWTPELAPSGSGPEEIVGSGEGAAVGVESITIQNIRAYREPQVFDLSAPVTVLYGPNGFGKTSLFDAIDFVATGGVGRLGLSATTDRFAKAITHLDAEPQEAVVSLTFRANGDRHSVTRRVATRMLAELDEAGADRKTVLAALTGGGVGFADRIENVVSLFRATHVFSQEHQELGREFHDDCRLPPQVLSRMLAFEDYASARSKASDVIGIFGDRAEESRASIRLLRGEIKEAEEAIRDLGEQSGLHGDSTMLLGEVEALRRRANAAGLEASEDESGAAFVRACRGAVQGRIARAEARIRTLRRAQAQVAAVPSIEKEVESLTRKREALERDRGELGRRLDEGRSAQAEQELLASELHDKRASVSAMIDNLGWIGRTRPRYVALTEAEKVTTTELRQATAALEGLRESGLGAEGRLADCEREVGESVRRLDGLRRLRRVLDELAKGVEAWLDDEAGGRTLESGITYQRSQLAALTREYNELSVELIRNSKVQDETRREVAAAEQAASELGRLAGELEGYVDGGCCPLCGHDHGTVEALLGRIRQVRAEDGASVHRSALAQLRATRAELDVRAAQIRKAMDECAGALQQMEEERRGRLERIDQFRKAAERVGFGEQVRQGEILAQSIEARRAEVGERTAGEQRRGRELQEELERLHKNSSDVERAISAAQAAMERMRKKLDSIQNELASLRKDRRTARISLESDKEKVDDIDRRQREDLTGIESALRKVTDAVRKRREQINIDRQKISTIESSLNDVERLLSAHRETIEETNRVLMESGLQSDADEKEIAILLDERSEESARLTELRDFAVSVEVALDTAATAAALQERRRSIKRRQRRVAEVEGDIAAYERWLAYFNDLATRVSGRQNEAVRNFAEDYGPMASAIQQRLRPVYGFEGIETGSHEDTVLVRVARGDEILRPNDYFSHSQQQTLLLGLFLTACVSQTWSSLSTVLLDDPITHFDDLNTYAFFDMIVGMVGAESGPRQFIMSTCDQDVFQLARSKMRHLGSEARFYEFSAIGPEGPVVEEVAPA